MSHSSLARSRGHIASIAPSCYAAHRTLPQLLTNQALARHWGTRGASRDDHDAVDLPGTITAEDRCDDSPIAAFVLFEHLVDAWWERRVGQPRALRRAFCGWPNRSQSAGHPKEPAASTPLSASGICSVLRHGAVQS